MSNLSKIQEGASVLQQVDVSDIFTSLAMGIAEAQKKLDDNSIAQLTKLAETKLGDKSLLELGFYPSFYAFQYADISANIHLKMTMKDDLTIGANLSFSMAKSKGYSNEESKFVSESKYSSLLEEYKSSKEFSFKVNKRNTVTVENEVFTFEKTEDVKRELRRYRERLAETEQIDFSIQEIQSRQITRNASRGLHVWMNSGYLRIEHHLAFDKDVVGLLRIAELTDNPGTFDLDGSGSENPFDNEEAFLDLFNNAAAANLGGGGVVYGISALGKLYKKNGSNTEEIPSDLYFKYNDFDVLIGTDLDYKNDGTKLIPGGDNLGQTKQNHGEHGLLHQCLRFINDHDPNVTFTITGFTDPDGGDSPKNRTLAENRAKSMRSHIFHAGTKVSTVIEKVTNNSATGSNLALRKASIGLNHNYIIFLNGVITVDATPTNASSNKNKFVYVEGFNPKLNKYSLDIDFGNLGLSYLEKSSIAEIVAELKTQGFSHSKENNAERDYLIHEEAVVKHTLFSSTKESIKVEDTTESVESGSESESNTIVSKDISKATSTLDAFKESNGSNTMALAANVDFRMTKQFDMAVEGNSSMSARMVAVPPPDEFKAYVQSLSNPNPA